MRRLMLASCYAVLPFLALALFAATYFHD